MTLFRPATPAAEQRTANLDATAQLIAEHSGRGRIFAGVPVNDDQAMRLSAVWGCVDLIAETVSTLPVDEFRNTGPGGTPQEQPTPRLLSDPGGDAYGFEVWARALMTSWLLRGNVYGLILSLDDRANPTAIELLHPDRISWNRNMGMGPAEFFLDGKPIDRWPYGNAQLWHVPAYTIPGSPVGLAPISYAAQTVGLGLATQKFGAQWFGDGVHSTAELTNGEGELTSEEDAKIVKRRVMESRDNREPLVLGGGWKLNRIEVSPNESQFLETIQANADDVARFFFRRPPGEGGEITYANVEARSIDLLTYTINGWLVRLEKAMTRLRPRGRYVKFNAGAMLRTDTKTKAEVDAIHVRAGISTPNERRILHDMTPHPDGDRLNWPPYTTSAPAAESGDVSADEEAQNAES